MLSSCEIFELPPDEDFANDMVSIGEFDSSSDDTDVIFSTLDT